MVGYDGLKYSCYDLDYSHLTHPTVILMIILIFTCINKLEAEIQ